MLTALDAPEASQLVDLRPFRLTAFARLFALAALFHLAGNARDALLTSPPLALASVLLAAAAAATLLRPHQWRNPALLSGGVLLTAWYEAPVVGNHWVLAAALGVAMLLSLGLAAARRQAGPTPVAGAFLPTARLTLLVAYGFAAFAKLNTGFLDPAVSCAVYFHDQLVGSWGLNWLALGDAPDLGRAVAVAAVVTELSVAVLLAVPATRRIGLVLAVGFHWLLAMDLAQHFWDFSSVLFAAFLLFLDDGQVAQARRWCRRFAARPARDGLDLVAPLVRVLTVLVVALAVLPLPDPAGAILVLLGHLGWWMVGTGVVLLVLSLTAAPRGRAARLRPPVAVLLVAPLLVLLNGLTPYLEVKTGFGWNMYSNLRTVAGETNHLLVPATLDLPNLQRDQVRIIASSEPALQQLVGSGYVMVYSEFREFAHAHPEAAVTYERGGRTVAVDRLADDPAGQGGVSAMSKRLQSFRVVDTAPEERCQPTFSPAR